MFTDDSMSDSEDADWRCPCDDLPPATTYAEWRRKARKHETCVKRREAGKKQTKGPCRNCGRLTNHHLIDTSQKFGSPERARRFCFGCRPGAVEDGRFVIDRTGEYPLEDRLNDLRGGYLK